MVESALVAEKLHLNFLPAITSMVRIAKKIEKALIYIENLGVLVGRKISTDCFASIATFLLGITDIVRMNQCGYGVKFR